MIGLGLDAGLDARQLNAELLNRGFLANAPRPDTLRLLPPFVLSDRQAAAAVEAIGSALSDLRGKAGSQ
jgi:acetylornithine aminotransferase